VIEKQRKKGRMATAEEEEEEEEKENARVRGRAAPCVDGTKRVPRTTMTTTSKTKEKRKRKETKRKECVRQPCPPGYHPGYLIACTRRTLIDSLLNEHW